MILVYEDGKVHLHGLCAVCGRPADFNPLRCPSLRVNPRTGQLDPKAGRVPVCKTCIERGNVERAKLGRPPLTYEPDAFDPIPEGELP